MVTIGNDTLPGTILTVDSAPSTGVNVGAPGDVVLIGQADLGSGTASANSAKKITTPVQARNVFGSGSMLAEAIVDALAEGAYPVYGIAPTETSVTGEDLSGLSSNTGSLDNAPVVEDASQVTFTINSTTMTTVLVYDDPSTGSPGTDEVYLNPITGSFNIESGATVGSAGDDVDYVHYDYPTAHEEVKTATFGTDKLRDIVDFMFTINENSSVVSDASTTATELQDSYRSFVIAVGGAGEHDIADTSTYSNSYDTSRLQLYYPTRAGDDTTVLGALAGRRAALGIDASPMFKKVEAIDNLRLTLDKTQEENLVGEDVNPLRNESNGFKIVEDYTQVTDSNTDEANFVRGFDRLVVDFVTEQVDDISQDYIGELHLKSARNAMRARLSVALKGLLDSNSITAYSLVVDEVDSVTASVDVGVKTTKPLRNIEANILGGDVRG